MNFLARLNRFIDLFVETFRQVGRGRIWLPLLLLFVLRYLVLQIHYSFLSPVAYPVISAWISLFPEARAVGFTHYPGHLLLLPYFHDWARFVVGFLFEGLVLGGVAMMFFDAFLHVRNDERMSWRQLLQSWFQLLAAWTILNALMLAAAYLLPQWLSGWLEGSPRRQLLVNLGLLPAIYIVLLATMYSVIPAVAVFGENTVQALVRSFRLFRRNPLTCLCLSAAMLIVPIIIAYAAGQSALIVQKLRPELVFWLLGLGLLVEIPISFLWMGTSVRLLIDEDG
ncbi:MAG: hypothetical protein ABIE70_09970 [bacterium]